MTKTQLAIRVRFYTKTTSNTFLDSDLLLFANSVKDELASLIAERDIKGNYFIVPSTDNLVADQREYAWPDDVLNSIYSIEASFTTATPLSYVLCHPDDFRRLGIGRTEANVTANYSNDEPRYEMQRRSIYLLCGTIIAVTNGLRIKYRAYPADLADNMVGTTSLALDPTTTTFGMPLNFHELWARRISIQWKGSKPKPIPLSPLEKNYEIDLERQLSAISGNDMSGENIATIPRDTGENY